MWLFLFRSSKNLGNVRKSFGGGGGIGEIHDFTFLNASSFLAIKMWRWRCWRSDSRLLAWNLGGGGGGDVLNSCIGRKRKSNLFNFLHCFCNLRSFPFLKIIVLFSFDYFILYKKSISTLNLPAKKTPEKTETFLFLISIIIRELLP